MQVKTKIKSSGKNLNLEIPNVIVQNLKLKVNDILICPVEQGKLIIELSNNSDYNLEDLLNQEIEISEEIDWGNPQGEEIW
jgi:antitoxin component of MazEF toxin-antitoxin module